MLLLGAPRKRVWDRKLKLQLWICPRKNSEKKCTLLRERKLENENNPRVERERKRNAIRNKLRRFIYHNFGNKAKCDRGMAHVVKWLEGMKCSFCLKASKAPWKGLFSLDLRKRTSFTISISIQKKSKTVHDPTTDSFSRVEVFEFWRLLWKRIVEETEEVGTDKHNNHVFSHHFLSRFCWNSQETCDVL